MDLNLLLAFAVCVRITASNIRSREIDQIEEKGTLFSPPDIRTRMKVYVDSCELGLSNIYFRLEL